MAKYTTQDRRDLAEKGHALPDGSFPIADVEDLQSAIRNWALGNDPQKAKRHILKRARQMNAMHIIPNKWFGEKGQGETLQHFGIKGMKWGIRKAEPDRIAARTARQIESGLRGRETVRASDVFNSPTAARGKIATNAIIGGVGAGLAVRALRGTNSRGPIGKVKVGLAAAGVILSALGVASEIRDARDVRNYQKNKAVVDRIARQRDIAKYGR